MGPSRPSGTAARAVVAALVCVGGAGTLWGLGRSDEGPQPVPAAVAGRPVALSVPAPRAPGVEISVAVARGLDGGPAAPPTAEPQPVAAADPLMRWAEQVGALAGLAPAAVAGYGRAEIAMRERMPSCNLSWVTVAAVDRVVPVEGDPGAALCAGGRDTTTAAGWRSAVQSVAGGPVEVERVFTVATTYAVATVTGTPISPAARTAIDFATVQIGLPYVWGGDGPDRGDAGFDCSGLTTAAYAAAGVTLPRTAHTQYFATRRVEEPLPGDLVFHGNPDTKIHHVGLYVGNGIMLNAPTFGQPVQLAAVRWPGDDYARAGRPG